MSTVVAKAVPGRIAKLLAILSVACFWLIPLSPVVAIGAVSMTEGASGWSRKLSRKAGSTVAGSFPINPASEARSVPCPLPVALKLPNR